MSVNLPENMTKFGYDADAEWEHSEKWIRDQTQGKGRLYDAFIEGTESGKSWALQHTTPNTAKPGGYELKRWAHTPDRDPGFVRDPTGGTSAKNIFIETPGISPKWNHPMLGPGQIPPGEPRANHEFLPEETEEEYISRVVWPMYGGPEQIAWEDLPGVHAWGSGKSPWYDPRVPWPSNVPRSPDDRLHTSRDYDDTLGNYGRSGFREYERYGHGPASNIELPPLPEGAHREQRPAIFRQKREGKRPYVPKWSDYEPEFQGPPRRYPPPIKD